MQLLRSLIFNILIYLIMVVYAVIFFIPALITKEYAFKACHAWCITTRWLATWMIGLKTEVRGTPPTGEVMIAAKHQSFLDIIVIYNSLSRARFIMKRELMFAPILGQYALRLGAIPVDRGKRGAAIEKMKRDIAKGASEPGQLVIYPQGTRVAPGDKKPYKIGTGAIYEQLNQPCIPVATNIGHFWPKRGILRKPGTCVVEFLDPIQPGMPVKEFMAQLEDVIETRSDELLAEAKENNG